MTDWTRHVGIVAEIERGLALATFVVVPLLFILDVWLPLMAGDVVLRLIVGLASLALAAIGWLAGKALKQGRSFGVSLTCTYFGILFFGFPLGTAVAVYAFVSLWKAGLLATEPGATEVSA